MNNNELKELLDFSPGLKAKENLFDLDKLCEKQYLKEPVKLRISQLIDQNIGNELNPLKLYAAGFYGDSKIPVLIRSDQFLKEIPTDEIRIGDTIYSSFETIKNSIRNELGITAEVLIKEIDYNKLEVFGSKTEIDNKRYLKAYFGSDPIKKGKKYTAQIISVFPQHLILDLFGLEIELPMNLISDTIITNLRDKFSPGDNIEVRIDELEIDKKEVKDIKVSVKKDNNLKAFSYFNEGAEILAKVIKLLKKSCIVDIGWGQTMLASLNSLTPEVNQEVLVKITKIDRNQKRIYGIVRQVRNKFY